MKITTKVLVFLIMLLVSPSLSYGQSDNTKYTAEENARLTRNLKRLETAIGRAEISLTRIKYESKSLGVDLHFRYDFNTLGDIEKSVSNRNTRRLFPILRNLKKLRQEVIAIKSEWCPELNQKKLSNTGVPEWSDKVYFHLVSGEPLKSNTKALLKHFETLVFQIEQEVQKLEVVEDQFETLSGSFCLKSKKHFKSSPKIADIMPIGPDQIENGEGHDKSRIPVSGRIPSVTILHNSPNNVFVGTAFGGVWHSTNKGTTWRSSTNNEQNFPVGAIASSFHKAPIILAGTGEANVAFRERVVQRDRLIAGQTGTGLLRSLNKGQSWNLIGQEDFKGHSFTEIEFSKVKHDLVVASGTMGAYSSNDGGENWRNITPKKSAGEKAVTSIALSPIDPNLAWVSKWGQGIFKTTNLLDPSGPEWTQQKGGLPLSNIGRIELDLSPTNPNQLLALISNADHDLRGVYITFNQGIKWEKVSNAPDLLQGQGFYNMLIAFSPENENSFFYGGVGERPGSPSSLYFATKNPQGWHFSPIGSELHVDFHDIAFDSLDQQTVYVTNDGGIWRSDDSGQSWTSKNKGLQITQVMSVTSSKNNHQMIFAGTQDNGTLKHLENQKWTHVEDGDGGSVEVDYFDQRIVYSIFFQHRLVRSNQNGRERTFIPKHPKIESHSDMSLLAPFALNPYLSGEIVIGADDLYYSKDRGDSWTKIEFSPTIANQRVKKSVITSIIFINQDEFMIGTSAGETKRFYRKENDTWSQDNFFSTFDSFGFEGYISTLQKVPESSRIMVTIQDSENGGVILVNDNAAQFIPTEGPVFSSALIDKEHYILGTLNGIALLNTGSKNIRLDLSKLPNVAVFDLEYHADSNQLLIGTFGRGVWKANLISDAYGGEK